MRRHFAQLVEKTMMIDRRLVVVTADLGYGMWDVVRDDYPQRFVNVGAAEQLMVGVCVGLALRGLRPIAYSITPFLLYRPFELIRNYVDHENLPVLLVGSGRGDDYAHDGFSHYAGDDVSMLAAFKNLTVYWPTSVEEMTEHFQEILAGTCPAYLNLRR
jgi:transketolase